MENNFDSSWGSNLKLNNFFFQYERDVLTSHLISLSNLQGRNAANTSSASLKITEDFNPL